MDRSTVEKTKKVICLMKEDWDQELIIDLDEFDFTVIQENINLMVGGHSDCYLMTIELREMGLKEFYTLPEWEG